LLICTAKHHLLNLAAHALGISAREVNPVPGLGLHHLLDLAAHALGVSAREVNLVEDRDDFEVRLEGKVDVSEGLGLDTLRGVDDEKRSFAGHQRPRHLMEGFRV